MLLRNNKCSSGRTLSGEDVIGMLYAIKNNINLIFQILAFPFQFSSKTIAIILFMIKKIILVLVGIIAVAGISAQGNLWSNSITYSNPNTLNPFTVGDVVATGITVSGIGRGPGINGVNGTDEYNADSWNTLAPDLNAYFSFTLTPDAGKRIDFSNGVLTIQRSFTGPVSFSGRSSVDGFANDLFVATIADPANQTGVLIELDMSAFQNIAAPITFRLYGWGASAASGTASVSDFSFTGTVETSPLPVTFGTLEAVKAGNVININWSTQQETNNDHFEVEASKDGSTFYTLKTVPSLNGNSPAIQYYRTSITTSDFAGLLSIPVVLGLLSVAGFNRRSRFYLIILTVLSAAGFIACNKRADIVDHSDIEKIFIRIKQVDINGQFKYSNIIQVVNK
ncbi:hypothetical protein [Niabella hibiscisoli]|uniref:hypothetical protein n=1 Tax=Niabella hibiscisoli TaxID=1825928 RepID=UPI001F109A2E|nr:hypothetical protein [Niabella hibiscisoli]MCH5715053.1 hypothetical protein [Niabella hibiscisoli]